MSMIEVRGQARGFELITAGTAAESALSADYIYPSEQSPSKAALISPASGAAYYRFDGGTPDSTHRHLLTSEDTLLLRGLQNLINFRVLSASGDITICVTYLDE